MQTARSRPWAAQQSHPVETVPASGGKQKRERQPGQGTRTIGWQKHSPAGSRTRVSRVTGANTNRYTTEDDLMNIRALRREASEAPGSRCTTERGSALATYSTRLAAAAPCMQRAQTRK